MTPRIPTHTAPRWTVQVALILLKELRVEQRTRELTTTTVFFASIVTVTAAVAIQGGPKVDLYAAPTVIWVAAVFACMLAVGNSWHRERDSGALDGLLTLPIARNAIFAGKAIALAVFMGAVLGVVVPLALVLFSLRASVLPGVALVGVVAIPGIAAAGTLFGSMIAKTRARELVLAGVLLPLLLPVLLVAVATTREVFQGTPFIELLDYFALALVFDAIFIAGGLTLFGSLIED